MYRPGSLSRRALLQLGFGAAAGVAAGKLFSEPVEDPSCPPTPPQTAGPFYPTTRKPDEDVDLTLIAGHVERAQGTIVRVSGQVVDQDCQPVQGALVEIWQANTWGRYDHERDSRNPNPLDPDFQGVAKMLTGQDGEYEFKTILPGSYPADNSGWIRPPHIHFRIARRAHHELTTQMYFAGQDLNESDRILQALPSAEQERVIVAFGPDPADAGTLGGRFNVVLQRA